MTAARGARFTANRRRPDEGKGNAGWIAANSDIPNQPAGDAQSRAARRLLRHEWQPLSATAQAIEVAIAQLLSDPAQASLAAKQMQTA